MYRSKEQSAYAKLINGALNPGAPLLAGAAAGLGKTHGYTIPLLSSGKRVAIALSTRQLIDQFMTCDALREALAVHPCTVAALRSQRDFATDRAYREHKEQALAAQVLVVTHAAAMIDSFLPEYACLRDRDVVLFDEADLLADAADLRSTFRIPAHGDNDPQVIVNRAIKSENEDERTAGRAIRYALEHPAPYKVVGFDDDDLVLKHRMPGRMLKPLIADCRRLIFTSGTLQVSGRFDHFVRAIGLSGIDPASRHIDPLKHGNLTVEIVTEEMTEEKKAQAVLGTTRPVLVLMTSHADTERLGKLLPLAVVRGRDEPLTEAVARCPSDGILVAAGAWSGLDSPNLRWKTVVIPRVPYGPPVELSGVQLTHYIDSKVTAIRRINQGLHRGLRTQDAECTLMLLDPRANRPEIREAIPARFSVQTFAEGQRTDMVLTKTERDPAVRKRALRHYGCRCQHEGCNVDQAHLLDVHHKNPIAEGERLTSIEEVTVLCANHHRQAHFDMKQAKAAVNSTTDL